MNSSNSTKQSSSEVCMMCDKPAVWIRSTQFAGDHPFCKEHAEAEEGFNVNDSYEYWYKVKDEKDL